MDNNAIKQMQGNWQNMVQQQEVMPPEGVWDAIALALQENEQRPDWQTKIYHAQAEPPVGSWQQITQALDAATSNEQDWQNRVYHYEAVPPSEAWTAVAEMLDKQAANADWDARLYHHRATPPAAVWNYITAQLNDDTTQVAPISQKPVRRMGWPRIAAAAAIVLTIAGTALWTLRDQFFGSASQTVAANDNPSKSQSSLDNNTAPMAAPDAIVPTDATADVATTKPSPVAIAAKNTGRKAPTAQKPTTVIAPLEYVTHNEMAFLPTDAVFTNTNKLPNEKGQTVVEINGMDAPTSNYINISGPDGQSVRVSAKFANLLGYLNDGDQEERLDRIIKESAFWKATFRQWREKMTDADAAPSPSNFMGLLEMVKVLQ